MGMLVSLIVKANWYISCFVNCYSFFCLLESNISWGWLWWHHRVQVCHLLPGEAALLEWNSEGKTMKRTHMGLKLDISCALISWFYCSTIWLNNHLRCATHTNLPLYSISSMCIILYSHLFNSHFSNSFPSSFQGDNSHWRCVPLSPEGDVSTQILAGLWVTVSYLSDKQLNVIMPPH